MIVRIKNVSVLYGDVVALDDLSIEINGGAIGLLGPNGAGKTTFIKTILGLLTPQNGSAEVFGMDVVQNKMEIRKQIGYVPESDCYIAGMSGVNFVAYMGKLCGMPNKEAIQRAHEILQYVGMDEERYRTIETYSTGMRQKIKLAQALMHDPELLLLDEPTTGMDPKGRQEMLDLIKDISSSKNINIILSSHLLPDIEYTCQDVIVLRDGKLVITGNIQELKATHKKMYEVRIKGNGEVFLSTLKSKGVELWRSERNLFRISLPEDIGTQEIFKIAFDNGIQIRQLIQTRYSLEDVFTKVIEE
ncbi:TPA: ABC transporter ATP-binding protein [Candidatus Poribacteria bacterium]|nr:ABC transporter ATP-binding protein [Candidatus Poribacteria bacterium]